MRLVKVVVCLILFATAAHAQPQTEDPIAAAKEHFRRGTQLYDLGRYLDSVVEFDAAFRKSDRPGFLLNIGQAYRLGGKPRDALAAYRGFLRRVPNAPQRPEAEHYIEELTKIIADEDAAIAAEKALAKQGAEKAALAKAAAEEAAAAKAARENAVVAAPPVKTPLHKKAWLWGVVAGVVVVGVGVGLGVGLTVGRTRDNTQTWPKDIEVR